MKIKLYMMVRDILDEYPKCKDSDKKLQWKVYDKLGLTEFDGSISFKNFVNGPSFESIRRIRQKLAEKYPEYRGSKEVTAKRKEKEESKGTFAYREYVDAGVEAYKRNLIDQTPKQQTLI